jgi:hypothetical protein
MNRSIVNGKIGKFLSALTVCISTGVFFLTFAEAYDSPGLNLGIYTEQDAGKPFMLGVDAVALLIVIKNEEGVPIVTARGFSQVELYKSLIVTDPKGGRTLLAVEDETHKMPTPYTLNGKDWDLAEILPQTWVRSVKIDDLREKVPVMNTTAGWYTIETQQPFVRFAATGNEKELGLIGLIDDPNNWSGSLKSNTLQIYIAPGVGAKVAAQVVNTGVDPVQPLAQVPVKVLRTSDIPSGSALSEAWDRVVPVLVGTTNFDGAAIWKSDSSCLVNGSYTVLAQYSGEVKGEQIASTEAGWATGCTGSIQKIIIFGAVLAKQIQITGAGFNFPESPKYRAVFSVSGISKDANLSGKVTYNYTRTRLIFTSTKIAEVSVGGTVGRIRGEGTVNQAKGYTFEVTAIDGAPDQFGITIWKPNGALYYQAATKALDGGDLRITVK